MLDRACSAALALMLVVAFGAYVTRTLRFGGVSYARVEQEGGSALLGKGAMRMGYWALQPFAQGLVRLRVSPAAITWCSLVLGAGCGVALAFGHFGLAALLSALSCLGDALDGLVARKTGVASDAGEVLDASVDRYVEFFFVGGLCAFFRHDVALLLLSLSALSGGFMVSYATAKAEVFRVETPRGLMRRTERTVYFTAATALTPALSPYGFDGKARALWAVVLGVIALFSHASSVRRLGHLAHELRSKG